MSGKKEKRVTASDANEDSGRDAAEVVDPIGDPEVDQKGVKSEGVNAGKKNKKESTRKSIGTILYESLGAGIFDRESEVKSTKSIVYDLVGPSVCRGR